MVDPFVHDFGWQNTQNHSFPGTSPFPTHHQPTGPPCNEKTERRSLFVPTYLNQPGGKLEVETGSSVFPTSFLPVLLVDFV